MKWVKSVLLACGALAVALSFGVALGDDRLDRAIALTAEKRYPEARDVLNDLLESRPGYSYARLLHGILRAREGRMDEAIDVFEALRRDHPDMSEPYNNLAVLYAVQGRLDDARRTLMAALERGPDAVVYANLGDVYTRLARQAYRRARELAPDGEAPGRQIDTTFPPPAIPAGRSEAASMTADPPASTMESPDAGTMPGESAAGSGGLVMMPEEPSMESSDVAAVEPRQPATAEAGENTAAPEVEAMSASDDGAAMASAFCARAEGFKRRRDVANAALWLQSYGAQVVEVRHEEHQVTRSHRVYMPPFASREEAAAMVREIRERGVRDVALIKDGTLANGISFGVYGSADNMRRRVSALDRLGYTVRSGAADIDVVEGYAIKARAEGTLADLEAAWAQQFGEHPFRLADCS